MRHGIKQASKPGSDSLFGGTAEEDSVLLLSAADIADIADIAAITGVPRSSFSDAHVAEACVVNHVASLARGNGPVRSAASWVPVTGAGT